MECITHIQADRYTDRRMDAGTHWPELRMITQANHFISEKSWGKGKNNDFVYIWWTIFFSQVAFNIIFYTFCGTVPILAICDQNM